MTTWNHAGLLGGYFIKETNLTFELATEMTNMGMVVGTKLLEKIGC